MHKEALRLVSVTKAYRSGSTIVYALKDVNLVVKRGELVAIMGPSGSGKSTLLSIAGTLDKPTEGRVYVSGVDVTDMSEEELALFRSRHIGFVFQSYNLLSNFTALENVMVPMLVSGLYTVEEARERARLLLKLVGLEDRASRFPRQLSGGEQQRVAIARALANDPDLVLMDEPTGNLDVASAARVVSLVKWLNEVYGQTFLVVTHDPEVAKAAGRTLYIRGGRLYETPPSSALTKRLEAELSKYRCSPDLVQVQVKLLELRVRSLKRLLSFGQINRQDFERELASISSRISALEKELKVSPHELGEANA